MCTFLTGIFGRFERIKKKNGFNYKDMEISIIIPAKNEAENIVQTICGIRDAFDKEKISFEIIVVNDGSSDETESVVQNEIKKDQRIVLINNSSPHGIGNAIKRGLDDYKGEYVILTMADSSDDPKDMVQYVFAVRKGYDCCFGTRWKRGVVVRGYPKFKLVLNRIANWVIKVFFLLSYDDITNAFKCYSRDTIEGIKPILSHHFNITVELPLKAIIRGYSYTVVPTNWYARTIGKTNLQIKEMGSRYLFIMFYVFLEKLLCRKDYCRK